MQDELFTHVRDIARSKETLIYLNDEISIVEVGLANYETLYGDLQSQVQSLHERAKLLMTLKLLKTTLTRNLDQPEFSALVQTYGTEDVVKRLVTITAVRPSTENPENEEKSPIAEQMNALLELKGEKQLESSIADLASEAGTDLISLKETMEKLKEFETKVLKIKTQLDETLKPAIEKRTKSLQDLKLTQQQNLINCLAHEIDILDSEKLNKPSQTLEKLLMAERQNLENKKDCQFRAKQVELMIQEMNILTEGMKKLVTTLEDIAENSVSELNPRLVTLKIPKTGSEEAQDDLSTLDPSDRLRRLDSSTEDYYLRKIQELRKLLVDEDGRVRQSQEHLVEMEEQVNESQEKLHTQKLKGMYFVLIHYLSRQRTKAVNLWKYRVEERKRGEFCRENEGFGDSLSKD